jgi:VWFA-related protein
MKPAMLFLPIGLTVMAGAPTFYPSAVDQDRPQFRAAVTGVAVHVLVRDGRRVVTDLEAGDFVLTDSGVRQEITALGAARVPLDVSLVVQQTVRLWFTATDTFRAEILEVAQLLRDSDRLRVVAAGDDVRELMPFSVPDALPEIQPSTQDTCLALFDALASVLVRGTDPGRQHVVIVMTQGEGGGDVVSGDVLTQLAQRSDARVHVLVTEKDYGRTEWRTRTREPVCPLNVADWSEGRQARLRAIDNVNKVVQWEREIWDYQRQRLVRIAEVTGGGEIRPSLFKRSIAGPVQHVLEEVRAGYVLYYEPKGAPDRGWHPIEVTVSRPGNFEVQARRGYMK